MDQKYNDQLCLLNRDDLNTDMFDNVLLRSVVAQPTEKPKSVGPHQSKLKATTNKKKSCFKTKKFRSVSTQLREGFTKPDNVLSRTHIRDSYP